MEPAVLLNISAGLGIAVLYYLECGIVTPVISCIKSQPDIIFHLPTPQTPDSSIKLRYPNSLRAALSNATHISILPYAFPSNRNVAGNSA
jgi:hypothetical protein